MMLYTWANLLHLANETALHPRPYNFRYNDFSSREASRAHKHSFHNNDGVDDPILLNIHVLMTKKYRLMSCALNKKERILCTQVLKGEGLTKGLECLPQGLPAT